MMDKLFAWTLVTLNKVTSEDRLYLIQREVTDVGPMLVLIRHPPKLVLLLPSAWPCDLPLHLLCSSASPSLGTVEAASLTLYPLQQQLHMHRDHTAFALASLLERFCEALGYAWSQNYKCSPRRCSGCRVPSGSSCTRTARGFPSPLP